MEVADKKAERKRKRDHINERKDSKRQRSHEPDSKVNGRPSSNHSSRPAPEHKKSTKLHKKTSDAAAQSLVGEEASAGPGAQIRQRSPQRLQDAGSSNGRQERKKEKQRSRRPELTSEMQLKKVDEESRKRREKRTQLHDENGHGQATGGAQEQPVIKDMDQDKRGGIRDSSRSEKNGLVNGLASKGTESRNEPDKERRPKKVIRQDGGALDTSGPPNDDTGLTETSWTVTSGSGGRYLDVAPIFSQSEKHIIFATERALSVARIDSSKVEVTHDVGDRTTITSFAGSRQSRNCVHLANSKGEITLWNWHSRKALQVCKPEHVTTSIAHLTSTLKAKPERELVFGVTKEDGGWSVRAYAIDTPEVPPITVLTRNQNPITAVKAHPSGRVILVSTPQSLLIGALSRRAHISANSQSADLEYDWYELNCKEPPTCFDFRFIPSQAADINAVDALDAVRDQDTLHVAYGGLQGSIYMHADILSELKGVTSARERTRRHDLLPRKLHWHRESVGAIAFSPDGNYLVSGGQETVLVLWQLQTGNKTFLPHLESPVRTLTISPSGSLYAVVLADNSIMVLSTAELKPLAHFAGLQSPSSSSLIDHRLILPTKESVSAYFSGKAATNVPSAVLPSTPNKIIVAVPSYQSANNSVFPSTPPSPYLQTFDSLRNLHVSRQALTRTNATSTNLGPEGNKLHEPDIAHIAVTSDGRWLATIDQWSPTSDDVRDLTVEPFEYDIERERLREVYLRIWRWNEQEQDWMLNTMLPSPHEFGSSWARGPASVLELVTCPATNDFATIGQDNVVRLWGPKTRRPDGRMIRGDDGTVQSKKSQTWWTLKQTFALDGRYHDEPLNAIIPNQARAAWSDDGSLLAVSVSYPDNQSKPSGAITAQSGTQTHLANGADNPLVDQSRNIVHLIDADFSATKVSQFGMLSQQEPVESLAFVDRYLLVLGREEVSIWDVPLSSLTTKITLAQLRVGAPGPKLSINRATSTFAVSVAVQKQDESTVGEERENLPPHAHRDFTSQVDVYQLPQTPTAPQSQKQITEPLLTERLPNLALALLSAEGTSSPPNDTNPAAATAEMLSVLRKGYLVIDSNASLRKIKPPLISERLASAMDQATSADFDQAEVTEVDDTESGNVLSTFTDSGRLTRFPSSDEERAATSQGQANVVSSQRLAEAIGEPEPGKGGTAAGALPSVKEMCDRVIHLFWGKTKE